MQTMNSWLCAGSLKTPVSPEQYSSFDAVQEARRLHEQEGVPYREMAVLFRAFKLQGGRSHTKLQVLIVKLIAV